MAFVAVYDACILYPAPLRDLLIRLAVKHLFQAKWSDEILDEAFRSILKRRPTSPQRAACHVQEDRDAVVVDDVYRPIARCAAISTPRVPPRRVPRNCTMRADA